MEGRREDEGETEVEGKSRVKWSVNENVKGMVKVG